MAEIFLSYPMFHTKILNNKMRQQLSKRFNV